MNEIKTRTYIHILTSSKLALFNVSFRKILQTFDFCDRVCLVVIDEIHLMKNWFNWRIKYDRFCELRSILSRIIFLFVTSITFEDELIAKLIKNWDSARMWSLYMNRWIEKKYFSMFKIFTLFSSSISKIFVFWSRMSINHWKKSSCMKKEFKRLSM
jgi:hypothetical protein